MQRLLNLEVEGELHGNGPIPLPSNEETPDEFDQHPSIIPKHESLLVHVPSSPSASGHKSESSPEPVSQAFRYIGSHPLIILFSVTLLALCVLLIVQVTLECKRRRRRASHFQYNQFDELPTYVEATTIKVPADSDSNGGVAADSNKV
ncbi:unnamed protein product [Echinostoma caproni]|uniref:APP_amyloid domain-containing protein n=1 Tax=Echinostoma caproni TaxID=27848 RepID=A0A183ACF3_9TREM|nr:unnamed protein product [Echinostoma caproni]